MYIGEIARFLDKDIVRKVEEEGCYGGDINTVLLLQILRLLRENKNEELKVD